MKINEKFPNSFISSSDAPSGLFSLCVFDSSVITQYSEDFQTFINSRFDLDRISFTHYGERVIMSWFAKLDLTIPANLSNVSLMIKSMFGTEWERLYNALVTAEYEPIENYNMVEHEEYDGSEDKTGYDQSELTHGHTVTTAYGKVDTMTHGHSVGITANDKTAIKDKEETTASSDEQNNIFGFNTSSINGVPADKRTGSGSSTVETTKNDDHTSTENHSGNDVDTLSGSDTATNGGKDTTKDTYNSGVDKDYERDLTRHGNIGVTTSQQMIESEIALREKRFIDIVLHDVINFFTIPIY